MSTSSATSLYMSKKAQKFVKKLSAKESLVEWHETLGHDGYSDGEPESDLWDLYLITDDGKDLKFYDLHREFWFYGTEPDYQVKNNVSLRNIIADDRYSKVLEQLCAKNKWLDKYVLGLRQVQ